MTSDPLSGLSPLGADAAPGEQVHASIRLVGASGKAFDLRLTSFRVVASIDNGFWGHEDISIPLAAVSDATNGWSRSRPLVLSAGGVWLITVFAVVNGLTTSAALIPWTVLLVFALAWKRKGLFIRSASAAISGRPKRDDDAKAFLERLAGAR